LEIKNGRVKVDTKRFIEKYQPLLDKVKTEANELIQDILDEYKFEDIFVCFDGGKDGHVVLDLFLKQLSFDHNPNDEINVVAVIPDSNQEYEELKRIRLLTFKYNLMLSPCFYKDTDIKTALFMHGEKKPKNKIAFMGSRRTDYEHLKNSSKKEPTDPTWPKLLRVYPILDWDYPTVWAYLLNEDITYCSMYNNGYTSIGIKSKTKPNERLKIKVGEKDFYLPAYCLPSSSFERCESRV